MSLLLALTLGWSAEAAERRYAVIVGSNAGDAAEVPLRFAERDAQRVAEVLSDYGGVAPEDMVRLEHPTAAELRGVLARMPARVDKSSDRTLLFVYYSGHADASSLHLGGTRFPLSELQTLVEAVPTDARVLVLDACRTGEMTRRKGAVPAEPFAIVAEDRLAADGMAIITSAAAGEDAQESDRLAGGVFTHHFLVGLQGAADSSGDGQVTLTESYRYSYDRTVVATSSAPTLQHPSFSFDLSGRDDLVLTSLSPSEHAGWLRLAQAGDYVLMDPRGQTLVAELSVAGGGVLSVRPGRYVLRRRTPDKVYEAPVEVLAGQTVVVTAADLVAVPYGQATRRGGEDLTRPALSMTFSGGVAGSMVRDLGASSLAQGGVRLDLPGFTAMARTQWARSTGVNPDLSVAQNSFGGEIELVKLLDFHALSFGPGVVLGGDYVVQSFTTTGSAPTRHSVVGRAGPVGRVEVSVTPRLSVGFSSGFDAVLLKAVAPDGEDNFQTRVVPYGALDVGVWVF